MKEIIKDIIIAVVIAFIVLQFVSPTVVKESSMEPTLYENNYLFLSKQSYRFGEPKAGDIIVFRSDLLTDDGKKKLLIKRVIGLPGDEVIVTDNKVYVNGTEIKEDYIKEQGNVPGEVNLVVPEDELFCMGDNREVSRDSRDPLVGTVHEEDVVGKAVFRLFPLSEIGRIH